MDKYRIDGHKYAYHPIHSSTVLKYLENREDSVARSEYIRQHPLYIEVSPVGACNHRCTFCAVDYIGYNPTFMNAIAYKRSLDSMRNKGCKSIMFAGEGEPLLHPEINEFVNYTKERLGIDVSFTTNAFRLSEKFVVDCLKNISWVKVSFNGGNPRTYSEIHRTSEADFEVVSNNIRFANKYRKENNINCAIGLQTLLLPENVDTIPDLCEHAKELGADYIVIKPYSQHKLSKTVMYQDIDYSQYLDLGDKLERYNSENFNVIFRINTIKNWLSQNNERYCKCFATPSIWAYWMANGDIYSCSAYLLDERFKLGNINDATFDEVWASEKRMDHLDFVLDDLDISECRVNCRMDQVNRYLDDIYSGKVSHINFV